jgi:hypothetical protein
VPVDTRAVRLIGRDAAKAADRGMREERYQPHTRVALVSEVGVATVKVEGLAARQEVGNVGNAQAWCRRE